MEINFNRWKRGIFGFLFPWSILNDWHLDWFRNDVAVGLWGGYFGRRSRTLGTSALIPSSYSVDPMRQDGKYGNET